MEAYFEKSIQHPATLCWQYLTHPRSYALGSPFCKLPVLGNRFVLQRLRGKGGSGEVWDAVDYADSENWCAIKLSTSHKHSQREHYTHSVRSS